VRWCKKDETQSGNEWLTPEIKQFWVKLSIFLFSLLIFLGLAIPDTKMFEQAAAKLFHNEKSRVLTLSFIQNPASLYRLSEIDEAEGKLDWAIMDMRLAIGLLEMHGASTDSINHYTKRLNFLETKGQVN